MSTQTLVAFLVFALATSITPGPNNLLLMTSGVNHGFRATLPHMLGVGTGFALLLLSTGLGLGELFSRMPALYGVMKWVGVAYLLYFAWRLAMLPITPLAVSDEDQRHSGTWTFRDGFAFQFVNPKGWIMATGAFSSYVPSTSSHALVSAVALGFALIALPCFALWVTFGSTLRSYLEQGYRRRIFNVTMASLLVASLVPLLLMRH